MTQGWNVTAVPHQKELALLLLDVLLCPHNFTEDNILFLVPQKLNAFLRGSRDPFL